MKCQSGILSCHRTLSLHLISSQIFFQKPSLDRGFSSSSLLQVSSRYEFSTPHSCFIFPSNTTPFANYTLRSMGTRWDISLLIFCFLTRMKGDAQDSECRLTFSHCINPVSLTPKDSRGVSFCEEPPCWENVFPLYILWLFCDPKTYRLLFARFIFILSLHIISS